MIFFTLLFLRVQHLKQIKSCTKSFSRSLILLLSKPMPWEDDFLISNICNLRTLSSRGSSGRALDASEIDPTHFEDLPIQFLQCFTAFKMLPKNLQEINLSQGLIPLIKLVLGGVYLSQDSFCHSSLGMHQPNRIQIKV